MWLNGPQSLALLTAVEFTLFIYIVEEIIFSQPQINSLRRAKRFLEFTTSFTSFILTVLFF